MTTIPDGAICIEPRCILPATHWRFDGRGQWGVCTAHTDRPFSVDAREVPWHKLSDAEAMALGAFDSDSRLAAFYLNEPSSADADAFRARRTAFLDTVLASMWDAVETLVEVAA